MVARKADPLPPEVNLVLRENGPGAAGEALVRHAEMLVRSQPSQALRWADGLEAARLDNKVLAGCARWAVGVVRYLAGDPARAEPALQDAASKLDGTGRGDLADRARLLLIDLHGERLRLDRARGLGRRLHRRFLERGDRERAAAALINLACAEDAADRVARARELWRRARRGLESGSLRRLLVDANLGNVAALEGRHRAAAQILSGVARSAAERGLEELALHAELNLAEVELAAGRVDAALARWQDVIRRAAAAGDDGLEVAAELDFAAAEAAVGNGSSALERVRRVVPRARELGLDREAARGLRLQLVLEAAAGRYGGWRRAVKAPGPASGRVQLDLLLVDVAQLDPTVEPASVVRAARRLARAGFTHRGRVGLAWAARRYLDRGRNGRARALAEEALQGRRVSPWVRMVAHHVLGRVGGRDSLRHLGAAGRAADNLHGRLAAAADRRAFLAARGEVYLDLLTALLERNRSADRRRALAVAGRLRSGWLVDELARRADRGDDALAHRWQELRCRLAALLQEIEGGEEPRVRRSGLQIHGALREVERELRSVEAELARRWPLPGLRERSGIAGELIRLLPPKDVFVEYFVDRRDLITFVARDGRLTVSVARGAADELQELVASVRFHMDVSAWRRHAETRPATGPLKARLKRLGKILAVPQPAGDAGRVWIAPHNGLFHIPWAAVPRPDGPALVDSCPFTLIPGAEAAVGLLQEPPRRPGSGAVSGAPANTLPMVTKEIRRLASLLGGVRVTETATRGQFLELLAGHELVHLAGHAVFLDGMPLASGLRLSDGYVTVHDLAATRLAARIVSFGVCSGLRVARDGGDAYAGFLLALIAGGVKTVIGPISAVSDEVAYEFDVTLHRMLVKSCDPGEAYRRAVGVVRERDPDPAVWGNFHLYGDQRKWGSRDDQ